MDVENVEATKHPEDNKSAGKIKQESLEQYLSSRTPQTLHFEKLGNYVNEVFCLTISLLASNFELYIYRSSLLIHNYGLLIVS